MQSTITRQKVIAIAAIPVLIYVAIFGAFWYQFSPPAATTSPQEQLFAPVVPIIAEAAEPVEIPIHITIPGIGVDAAVEEVGITTEGAMDVPMKSDDAAWYSPGTRPGEIGSAVIAGHLNSTHNAGAVFTKLSSVNIGDIITTQTASGSTMNFIITSIKLYAADQDATDVFTSTDGKAHLNLITCAGAWNNEKKQNEERLVVFAELQ